MVCSIILAGWPPLPWGHTGMGPVPAMLSSILPFADPSSLQRTIDVLLKFHEATVPMFLTGGRMRPLIDSAFASLVMYYPERHGKGEMTQLLDNMRDAYTSGFRVSAGGRSATPHHTLVYWSGVIRAKFDHDVQLALDDSCL